MTNTNNHDELIEVPYAEKYIKAEDNGIGECPTNNCKKIMTGLIASIVFFVIAICMAIWCKYVDGGVLKTVVGIISFVFITCGFGSIIPTIGRIWTYVIND